jgi:rod shape-determining protein MreC
MDTRRDDVGIAFRSALLDKGSKQRFSLFALVIISLLLIFAETIETKPLNVVRSFFKDTIYRVSVLVSMPGKSFSSFSQSVEKHFNLYKNYNEIKKENDELRNIISKSDFLELQENQLEKLIQEQKGTSANIVNARVLIDKQSPYLNSFVINIGTNKNIKNGMAVLSKENFIGRIVDVNYFSSRVLLITDLNSKIPVILEPSGYHGILSGHGANKPSIDYLPANLNISDGDIIYTSGKEGIFSAGIPIAEALLKDDLVEASLFVDLNQITFVSVVLANGNLNK